MPIKLTKAIEFLELDLKKVGLYIDPDRRASIGLGIEALKVLDLARFNSNGEWPPPLPGEQPEEIVKGG